MTELDRLVSWYAVAWLEEPASVDQLHRGVGPDGAPEWSDQFRHYIADDDDNVDMAGYYTKPLHAALLEVRIRTPRHWRFLTNLRVTWDVQQAAWAVGVSPLEPAEAEDLARRSLRHLRREYRVRAR